MIKKYIGMGMLVLALTLVNCTGDNVEPVDTQLINPDTENPDTENPDTENPDTENPDTENPDTENPDTENPTDPENPTNPGTGGASGYAMTAKINGVLHTMMNPFGNNNASNSIYGDYPDEDYIFLQGRWGGILGPKEFDLWIKRTDLHTGTFEVNDDTFYTATHIDLIDNTNEVGESTISGHITITEVNTTAKTVKGTFEFEAADSPWDTVPLFYITEGTFYYNYDVD